MVELWDIERQQRPQDSEAFEPWSEEPAGARSVDALCKRIATVIKGWIDNEEVLASKGRKVKAGDILILVRRRDPFTTPMIRELKRLAVPVAGADRMLLTDQLAVQDLVALADFLLMPEDDLTLAVVLKGPLFDFDDDDLFTLAHRRGGSLWAALRDKATDAPRFAAAAETLSNWLGRADFLPPYEFFSELLGADGQRLRKAMLTRLGPEAAEAIDEFLDLALTYDREAAPSLQGFVNQLRAGDVEIKRDMEQERDEVRIMTVHGAKGLQAPIVFLPDTCMRPRLQGPQLYRLDRAGEPARSGRPSGLAAERSFQARRHRNQQGRWWSTAERAGISPAALRRHDARARTGSMSAAGRDCKRREDSIVWYDLVNDGLAGQLDGAGRLRRQALRRMEMQADGSRQGGAGRATQDRQRSPPPRLGACAGAARAVAAEARPFATRSQPRRRKP